MDWQYSTGRGEWRQWETTVSYGPTMYQVRLKPNYGEREERGMKGKFQGLYSERKDTTQWELPSTFRTRSRRSFSDLYTNSPRLGDRLGGSRKIRLLDTTNGEKSPSGLSLDPPHSAARHLTSRHDLNNLNPVSGIGSS